MKKRLVVATVAFGLLASSCGWVGAATNAGAKKDTFSIETDAGEAVCVFYVAESAALACTWPGE